MISKLIRKVVEAAMVPTLLAYGYTSNFQMVTFRESSMEPTISDGDYGLCWKVDSYPDNYKSIKTGDVVIVTSPEDPGTFICKRVGATEDDDVCHGNGTNYVPPGHVWLEGDNKGNSRDSRYYGTVPIGLVNGVVRVKFNLGDFSVNMVKKH